MRTSRLICMLMAAVMLAGVAAIYATNYKEGDKGTFVGAVTEKGDDWFIAKNETASERFIPVWVGGAPADGGGYEKATLAKIKDLKVGDKVEVSWLFSEHLRAVEITVVKAPAETQSQ